MGNCVLVLVIRDSTCLVDTSHPLASMPKVHAAMRSACTHLGRVAVSAPLPDKTFFLTVQKRVESHLRESGLPIHYYEWVGFTEVFLTLALYAWSVYFKVVHESTLGALACGFLLGRIGFLMHMGNHCAFSKYMWFNQFVGQLHDLAGSTHLVWRFEHNVAHHMDPNELGKDNDCEIGNPMMRFHPELPRKWIHRYQHIYTPILMTGGVFKW